MSSGVIGLFVMLLLLVPIAIFAQEKTSMYYFAEHSLYDNAVAGDELVVSADKFTYKQGEFLNILGHVFGSTKERVFLDFYNESGEKIFWIQTMPSNSKLFEVIIEIPNEIPDGRYTVDARYGGMGKPVSLGIVVEGKPDSIIIPQNSFDEMSKLSFEPSTYSAVDGEMIAIVNEDTTVHRILEGKPKFSQGQETDAQTSLFDSGYLKPGQTFQFYLPEGEYQYFCPIHPWTVGYITVNSLNDITENSVSSQSFLTPENDFITIKTGFESYNLDDTILVSGKVIKFEPDSNLIIQVMDPNDDLVVVGQIPIIQDKSCCLESDAERKVIAGDNLSNWFAPWKKDQSVELTLYNREGDSYEGVNSLEAIIDTTNGPASFFHDYGVTSLQDWSEYDYLSFWYKGEGIVGTHVILRDKAWGTGGEFEIIEDSNKWSQVLIPISTTYDLNLSEVRTLEFNFPYEKITDAWLRIDGIKLLKEIPEQSGSFAFTLYDLNFSPSKNGLYKINAVYGEKQHVQTPFLMNVASLVEKEYKGFDIYKEGVKYYGIPTGEEFDSSRLRNIGYNKIFSSDSLGDMKKMLMPFPVSDAVLLEVWNARNDVKLAYPEVALGDFSNLKEWTMSTGWKEESLLSPLIPEEKLLNKSNNEKALTMGSLSNWFTIWKKDQSVEITLSNVQEGPYGVNSLEARIDTTNGPASFFHDYGVTSLQDWSEYDYLSFWYKGEGIVGTHVILRDKAWGTGGEFEIIEDSNKWSQVLIPISTTYDLNLSEVRTLEFNFPYEKITDAWLRIDGIKLLKEVNKQNVPILNEQIFLAIWKQESSLQSKSPEIKPGNLGKLKIWAIDSGLEIESFFELTPEEEIRREFQNTLQPESEKLVQGAEDSGLDDDGLILALQFIVAVIVVAIGIIYGYKIYKDNKNVVGKIPPERAYSF